MKFNKILAFLATIFLLGCPVATPNEKSEEFYDLDPVYIKAQSKVKQKKAEKTKFYNFDDLLINGEYKKPKTLYVDARQKAKFEKLLKLKKSFLPNLKNTRKDPVLR